MRRRRRFTSVSTLPDQTCRPRQIFASNASRLNDARVRRQQVQRSGS
jgi:hypothetical protein